MKSIMKNNIQTFSFLVLVFAFFGALHGSALAEKPDDKLIIQPYSAQSPHADVQMVELAQKPQKKADSAPVEVLTASQAHKREIEHPSKNITHDAIKLTPDKSEVIKLDRPASTVIVGNPSHVSVLADSSNTIILVARAPGATHFAALDADGEVIMARHVIVASPQKKYMRVRRSCATTENCQTTQMYYCPDMCHEILLDTGETTTNNNQQAEAEENASDLADANDGADDSNAE